MIGVRNLSFPIGIGKGLAFELAALKFNVIIHAATEQELKPVQRSILSRYPGIQVICAPQDASKSFDWAKFMRPLSRLNITVLINNVGISGGCGYTSLDRTTDERIEATVRVNAIFPTQLTRNLLPILSSRGGPSIILNLSSVATIMNPAFLTVYTATKGYNLSFSKSLRNELRTLHKDVESQAVVAGSVQTGSYTIPTGFFVATADEYARYMLSSVGGGSAIVNGWWRHRLAVGLFDLHVFIVV